MDEADLIGDAELCGTALDEIGADVEAGVASIEVDAIHLEQGTARLWDDDADGTIDRVDDGFFRAALNLGAGQRRTNATFRGVRLPDPSEPPIE